ncbi:glycerophosphodiester phosphodiesterase family protein [Blastococcus xanthinilyticus]|uniref:Glycerophosphoryl diester phosphodiesterase n=1 Tax=Blastococcus xanthinilyticus TaxID=1564164 RepID=A0A5S5CXU9_9ACTN|nr:glycerophosphodiester phosphodiesterase family protein [Blastococcus xanthinilyticus]TYP88607.1 glycerophosphoryl diester phosphodiesterase [Blastococcus xanthinilyticus]
MALLTSSPRRSLLAAAAVPALLGLVATAAPAAADSPRHFDLQAHRGGIALTVENTLPAFANALELGVSTLELDVQITEDGKAVVTHDRKISGTKCLDTGPATPGDPEYPYVGDYVHTLTLAQVRTLDCGSQRLPAYPEQELSPGEQMPLLSEVFELARDYKARKVTFNIETKVEAGAPEETAPREQFVQIVSDLIMEAKVQRHVTIQSFDWGTLMRMKEVAPNLPVVALTNGQQFLQAGVPGASPWLGGIDIDDFMTEGRSLQEAYVAAVDSFGADAVSPVHGTPQNGSVADPGYVPFTTPELVDAAHAAGMDVIPWTVNDRPTMEHLIGIGVDGLITDRPDLLREILAERGFRLPQPYELRGAGRP